MKMLKTILFMLIVIAMGIMVSFSSMATTESTQVIERFSFSLEKLQSKIQQQAHDNVKALENLTAVIKQLQNKVEYLEQELAKKTGIEIRAQNPSVLNTEQAITQAKQLLSQDHLTQAGLYFSHAISQAPGNWQIVYDYQQSILDYCQQRSQQGDYQTVLNVLAEMEAFLSTQALYLSLPDLTKLEAALAEIAQYKQSVVEQVTIANRAEATQFLTSLLASSDELLAKTPSVQALEQMSQYLIQLKDHVLTLQSLDIHQLEPTESAQVTQKIQLVENAIAHHEQQLKEIQLQANFSNLVQRAEQFINQAQQEPNTSHFTLYYLTSAESIIRQLVLQMPAMETNKSQITTLLQQLEVAKTTIAQRESQRAWQEIKQAFEQLELELKKEKQAGKAMEKLHHFRQTMAEKSSQLVALAYLEKAQALMERVNGEIVHWQNEQRRRYERWAINRIKNFHSFFQNELGMGTDELRVYQGMIHHLGYIDTRYLSTPALTGYNEAFNMFYAELSNERKIPLSSAMTLKGKKPLADF